MVNFLRRFFFAHPMTSWVAAGLLLTVALATGLSPVAMRPRGPNVILIVADDLGFMDIAANNPATFHETPNLDRLARMGMRFSNGYAAAPVCSPTRACLLTGKHPARLGITNVILTWPNTVKAMIPAPNRDHLEPGEITLAEAFREAGYRILISGKWHLGGFESIPSNHGFDDELTGDGQMFYPNGSTELPMDDDPKMSVRIAGDAVRFIDRADSRPFFAYLPFPAPHLPLKAPRDLIAKYTEKLSQNVHSRPSTANPVYAAMIEQLDQAVGRILDLLETRGLTDNTIIIFTSDNGGLEHFATSNAPLRGGKGTLYEGGIRVPLIISAPSVTPPGSVSDAPAITADLYPTLLELAGLSPRPTQHLDGISLVPTLRQEPLAERNLTWHFPHYSVGSPAGAIRCGDWKLLESFEDGRTELYNLRNDVSESVDLASREPERVRELHTRLIAWRTDVNAQMPKANPNWKSSTLSRGVIE